MIKLLKYFNRANNGQMDEKELIVKNLLDKKHISTEQAIILLKTINIKIEAEKLEMSSGAKIVGDSDFETNDYGRT